MSRSPSAWSDTAYSLRRYYVDTFHERYVAALANGSRVLDLGGTRVQKRGRFDISRYDLHVVSANLSVSKRPDVQADAHALPFGHAAFDAVVCSELLEHVRSPGAVVGEIARVLRPRGRALICVPFLYQEHGDPYDYGRYTETYWREELTARGLDVALVERQGALWSVIVDALRAYAADGLSGRSIRQRSLRVLLGLALPFAKRLAVAQDGSRAPTLPAFTTGFGIVADRRP